MAVQTDIPTSVTLTVAIIAASATIIAAFIAAWSAISAKRSETQAARARDLENRLAEQKYKTYKPMIEFLRDIQDSEKAQKLLKNGTAKKKITEFITWISIYGSDEAVIAFHNFMQASYNQSPAALLLRFYAEFVIAARKDIGSSDTKVTAAHILGMKITDLYQKGFVEPITLPMNKVYKKLGWVPPWRKA